MTAVARYQYQEVNNFILFPSLIPLIKQRNGFLRPISYFQLSSGYQIDATGFSGQMTTGVMKDRIFYT